MEFKKGVLGINDERYRYDRNDSMMISSVSVCALPSDLPLPRVSASNSFHKSYQCVMMLLCIRYLSSTQHIATRFEPVPGGKVDL